MSWCDKLSSVPAVGVYLTPYYASGDEIVSSLQPVISSFHRGNKSNFTIERHESFVFSLSTDDGFTYFVDPTKLSVTFNHKMRGKPSSAGPPIMEMISVARPYTQLLPEVIDRMLEALSLLPGARSRGITRVGVVSSTYVTEADMPPGVLRLLRYMKEPWNGNLPFYNINLAGQINETDAYSDRCIYNLNKGEDSEDIVFCNFDWQRIFSTEQPLSVDSAKRLMVVAEREALRYFEELAEGNRWDAELISASGDKHRD